MENDRKEPNKGAWGVFQEGAEVHVAPLDSVHAIHDACWCMPEILTEDWGVMVVHRKPN